MGIRGGGEYEDENAIGLIMKLRSFSRCMLRLGPVNGLSRAFFNFLDIACSLNADSDSDSRFHALVRMYDKQQRYLFMEAYTALVLEMTGDGSGLMDVLGEFYSRYVCIDWKIMPQQYYDMLPGMLKSTDMRFRMEDYHCRSGRKLLAAAKINRNVRLFGADADIVFVRISLLNLCINGLFGEVAWYDVTNRVFHNSWVVDLGCQGKPVINAVSREESLVFRKMAHHPGIMPLQLVYNF